MVCSSEARLLYAVLIVDETGILYQRTPREVRSALALAMSCRKTRAKQAQAVVEPELRAKITCLL